MIFFFFRFLRTHTMLHSGFFFYSWKRKKEKKSRETSRERRPRLAGTWRRVLTGEGNFPNAQTPGLARGSQRGQDTCAVLYLNSLQRASAFTGVHTSHLFISDFTGASDTLSSRRAQVQSVWEEEARQNVDLSVFFLLRWALCTNFKMYLQQ